VDVAALVEDVAARFRAAAPVRTLEVQVDPGLPPLHGDPELLRRLLGNLLDNARKYSEAPAPVALSAHASAPTQSNSVRSVTLAVADRGIGIDPADLPRIFTPFFRTDRSRARGTGGFGLGLALAKRIAEAHGGTLTAESTPGDGTVVTARLPTIASSDPE
jgi:signal transduction histidine kinase